MLHSERHHAGSLRDRFLLVVVSLVSCLLHACVTTETKPIQIGEDKNSFPFVEKKTLEEVRVIAIPAFHGDTGAWRETAADILGAVKNVTILRNESVDAASGTLQALSLEERGSRVSEVGKALKADAALNGVILKREGRREIILQLIAAKEPRILWWQAVDITPGDVGLSLTDQQSVLAKLLKPLQPVLATREKQPEPPPVEPEPKVEEPPKPEPIKEPVKQEQKAAPKSKKKSGAKPSKPLDVSPM
jgi:hypothetical protein